MATAIVSQPPLLPATMPTTSAARSTQGPTEGFSGKAKATATGKENKVARGRRERPCDACRRRKSKCVATDGQNNCAACGLHGQDCTYLEDPQPRKRRLDTEGKETDSAKRRSISGP